MLEIYSDDSHPTLSSVPAPSTTLPPYKSFLHPLFVSLCVAAPPLPQSPTRAVWVALGLEVSSGPRCAHQHRQNCRHGLLSPQDPPLASSSAEKAGALQPCSFTFEHIWLDPQRKSQSEHHPPCLLSSQCFSRLTVDVVKNG